MALKDKLTVEQMAAKLLQPAFGKSATALSVAAVSDPIADTAMVVTLDQLRPYEHNPRVTRNPAYDDIKASIRGRGLDAPPTITRRPGEQHYIIRNGGNTRLAILRELWSETKEERFYRIACLFKPWTERGEIIALTGHLAENDLRGNLTFIEKALGVEKAREFYERENSGEKISLRDLSDRLTTDGYTASHGLLSQMSSAVRFLLPAIPTLLYAGLSKATSNEILRLRAGGKRAWRHFDLVGKDSTYQTKKQQDDVEFPEYDALFQDVLSQFDTDPQDKFSIDRLRDELIGEMSVALHADYEEIALSIDNYELWQKTLAGEASPFPPDLPKLPVAPPVPPMRVPADVSDVSPGDLASLPVDPPPRTAPDRQRPGKAAVSSPALSDSNDAPIGDEDAGDVDVSAWSQEQHQERIQQNTVSDAGVTPRLQAMQRQIAEHLGHPPPPVFEENILQSIPLQAGSSVHPITDIWYIDPRKADPQTLRKQLASFAWEIANEAGIAHALAEPNTGVGFDYPSPPANAAPFGIGIAKLLRALSSTEPLPELNLSAVLCGQAGQQRLSDEGLVKFFRLVRLARKLFDLEHKGG